MSTQAVRAVSLWGMLCYAARLLDFHSSGRRDDGGCVSLFLSPAEDILVLEAHRLGASLWQQYWELPGSTAHGPCSP